MSAAGPTEAETGVAQGESATIAINNVYTGETLGPNLQSASKLNEKAILSPNIAIEAGFIDAEHEEEDVDDDDDLGKNFETGTKLRDLSGSETQQFPGVKREHWWYASTLDRAAELIAKANLAAANIATPATCNAGGSRHHTGRIRFAFEYPHIQCQCCHCVLEILS